MFIWIYKLIKKNATNDDMIYIGSTNDTCKRWHKHKSVCNNLNDKDYHNKVYQYIRENGGIDEWQIVILDEIEVPLIKCEERDKCENEYILKYDAINKLNKKKALQTKEDIKDCYKKYYENNREKVKDINKKNYENNREKVKDLRKKYYENNREKVKDWRKKYYENNREKITCDICGAFSTKCNLARHRRTQKCINFKNLTI